MSVMRQEPTSINVVFVLQHLHGLPTGEDDVKLIGVYASQASAEAARERVRRQPGFADHPDGFTITQYETGKDHWTEGFVTVVQG